MHRPYREGAGTDRARTVHQVFIVQGPCRDRAWSVLLLLHGPCMECSFVVAWTVQGPCIDCPDLNVQLTEFTFNKFRKILLILIIRSHPLLSVLIGWGNIWSEPVTKHLARRWGCGWDLSARITVTPFLTLTPIWNNFPRQRQFTKPWRPVVTCGSAEKYLKD